ncbi:hypothetical protein B296_00035383 [Ensete ventricosum]|uniref:Uncharacterized protein n=1 Tax=Ensete ventricosum TaxID=4639 RepID=A0A426WZ36_ENSVE|nr:hypothetical protein B296_00035383 [Ensete ventricosum]
MSSPEEYWEFVRSSPEEIESSSRFHWKDAGSSPRDQLTVGQQRLCFKCHDGPRYSLGMGPSSDDVVGSHRKFTRRFTKRIGKLAGNAKGDSQEEDQRTCSKIAGGCRSIWKLGLN